MRFYLHRLPLAMRGLLVLCVLALAAGVARASAPGPTPPLRLGILPFNSTLALIKTHLPLRQHLQAELGRDVEIYTAHDYAAFHRDSLAGAFDLLITGPHFGVMALDHGWRPLFHYRTGLRPVFVVRAGSGLERPEQLKGKRIGLSNRLSVSSIVGLQWLAEQGLTPGEDYQVVERATHGAAIAAVAVGDLDAALTTHTPLRQVPPDVRAKVTEWPTSVEVPHLMTLAHARLGADAIERVRRALLRFQDTVEGQAFFRDTGYLGYRDVAPEALRALRPYVAVTERMLRQP